MAVWTVYSIMCIQINLNMVHSIQIILNIVNSNKVILNLLHLNQCILNIENSSHIILNFCTQIKIQLNLSRTSLSRTYPYIEVFPTSDLITLYFYLIQPPYVVTYTSKFIHTVNFTMFAVNQVFTPFDMSSCN